MAFAETGLGVVAEAHCPLGFTWWSYATTDPLGLVLEPGYFNALSRRVQAGDLVLVGVRPGSGGAEALLMVSRAVRNGAVAGRLVQDYGGPEEAAGVPAAAPVPPRPRGRPPKARDGVGR